MAMAMGVATLAPVAAPRRAALVTPRASASNRGEKQSFLDWFRSAFDKESLSETDAVLAKDDGTEKSSGNAKTVPGTGNKKAPIALPPLKKAGFNFFGKK